MCTGITGIVGTLFDNLGITIFYLNYLYFENRQQLGSPGH